MEAEPKTRQSRRSIVLSGLAMKALHKHKQLQDAQKQNAEDAWEDHDYVFCNPLGRYIHPNTLRQQFEALLSWHCFLQNEKCLVQLVRLYETYPQRAKVAGTGFA